MPTHGTRYKGHFFSSNGRFYHFKIYEKGYAAQEIDLTIGSGGVKIKYDTSGQEKFSPIVASKCALSVVVENNTVGQHFENFLTALRTTAEEGDATVVIWNTGGTSGRPIWSGNIMLDLSAKEDVSRPYEIELNATDGLGLLKNYDMVQTQGTNPYPASDTYAPTGYKRFTYWFKEILEFCNTPDGDTTDGDVSDWKYSISNDWWYEDHPTASITKNPLYYTRCSMKGSYTLQEDGKYKVQNVYKVLEAMCKVWGMRVVFWRTRFYFVQIELYKTSDAGTFAVPDDIDTQVYNRDGTIFSSRSYVGESDFTAYSQDIETNAGGFAGGLQKLAGSKWDYYPKLKEVSVDFVNISNNNFFTTFPQPYSATFDDFSDNLTSSALGVISDASAFTGFNLNIDLEFNNLFTYPIDWQYNFSIRARPDGDTDWDDGKYLSIQPGLTTSWANYPDEQALGAGAVWFDYFKDLIGSASANLFQWYQQYNIHPHVGQITIPSGTSQQTIFSQQVPTDAAFVGDWEFELFCMTGRLDMSVLAGWTAYSGHHVRNTSVMPIFVGTSITYSDVLDANNNPISQFNPILNNAVGGNINTSVYSNTTDTESQEVKDIWWGDTLTNGEPSSLKWYDASGGSGYTDPSGKWRRGQTGSFDSTLSELMAQSRLFFQQTADYKWSLSTAVSDINWWESDGTALRPVYVNPVGRIEDTVDGIFYYLLRGTFNILQDEWEGEWLQISYNDGITTTTTTTTTGGTIPSNNTANARLSGGSQPSPFNQQPIGSLTARIAFGSTVTSLTIDQMNPIVNTDTTEYMFAQNTIIRAGDVFNVLNRGNGVLQQFTASADVSNTATTISVESVDILKPLEVGSIITADARDCYQQINHKTRGTIHIPQYSLSESSTDPADPAEGNAVIWMSDGTASGNDGDIIAKIQAGGVVKRFNIVDFGSFTNTYSIDFDGVDDYIDVSGAATEIGEALGSVSLWVKLDSVSGSITAFQAAVDASNFIRVWYKDSDSTLRFQTKRGGTNNVTYYAGGIEADGNWHHLALTWDSSGNELKGYLDGVARGGTGTAAGTWSGTLSIVHIGKQATASASYWKGNIDEVGLWSSVLTAAEIAEIYNSGTPLSLLKDAGDYSSSADLVGWWRMGDSATYPTIPDDSTNSNNGTMTNMAEDDIVQDIPE